jgi:hypothetical protein
VVEGESGLALHSVRIEAGRVAVCEMFQAGTGQAWCRVRSARCSAEALFDQRGSPGATPFPIKPGGA